MKGLEPIVSAVIILMITVVAGVTVSGWLSTFSTQKAADIKNLTNEQLSCKFADIYIKNSTYNCNNDCSSGIAHTITATVVNSGKKLVNINKIVVQNTTGSIYSLNLNETKSLNIGDTITLVNITSASCSGINRTIDKIIISSLNCPLPASDSVSGSGVTFINCG